MPTKRLGERAGFVVVDVRGDLQALEVDSLQRTLDAGFDAFFEGNPFVPARLREAGVFERFETLSVFLSPLARNELLYLKMPERRLNLGKFVTDIQRRKLLHRTKRQKVILSLKDLENIETRAASALREMREAWKCDHVIPLYDGEGNDNWDAFYYPVGSARNALETFAALLRGEHPEGVERWEKSLLEDVD